MEPDRLEKLIAIRKTAKQNRITEKVRTVLDKMAGLPTSDERHCSFGYLRLSQSYLQEPMFCGPTYAYKIYYHGIEVYRDILSNEDPDDRKKTPNALFVNIYERGDWETKLESFYREVTKREPVDILD